MYGKIKEHLEQELQDIKDNGLYKKERIITSPKAYTTCSSFHLFWAIKNATNTWLKSLGGSEICLEGFSA